MIDLIDKDILFDKFGDISIEGDSFKDLSDIGEILYQNVIHRLITNFTDYRGSLEFGSNLSSLIGSPVSIELEETIKNRIMYALTFDNFLLSSRINIITFALQNNILVRININIGNGQSNKYERVVINSIFSQDLGLLHAAV